MGESGSSDTVAERIERRPQLSYGSGLGQGWHSHRAATLRIDFYVGDEPVGAAESGVYLNTPVSPSALPKWPKALSLHPDLEGRRH